MFPGAGANIYRNEAGEVLGWDYPSEPDPYDYDDERPEVWDEDDDDEPEPDEEPEPEQFIDPATEDDIRDGSLE
jgi:hypothetical protein